MSECNFALWGEEEKSFACHDSEIIIVNSHVTAGESLNFFRERVEEQKSEKIDAHSSFFTQFNAFKISSLKKRRNVDSLCGRKREKSFFATSACASSHPQSILFQTSF